MPSDTSAALALPRQPPTFPGRGQASGWGQCVRCGTSSPASPAPRWQAVGFLAPWMCSQRFSFILGPVSVENLPWVGEAGRGGSGEGFYGLGPFLHNRPCWCRSVAGQTETGRGKKEAGVSVTSRATEPQSQTPCSHSHTPQANLGWLPHQAMASQL